MASQVLASLTPQQGDSIQTLLARLIGTEDRGTLLASAVRTSTTTAVLPAPSRRRGVALFWNNSVNSGAGGLRLFVQVQDPVSLSWTNWAQTPQFTTSGLRVVLLAPSFGNQAMTISGTNANFVVTAPLVAGVRVQIEHGGSNNETYSLAYEML